MRTTWEKDGKDALKKERADSVVSGSKRPSRQSHCSVFSASLAEASLYTLLNLGTGCVS
jgi:hypothetical protein